MSEMTTVSVITNHHPRPLIDALELTAAEREQFDYLDWCALEAGEDSAWFFRFRGDLFDLGEFSRDYGVTNGAGLPSHFAGWDGYMGETAFSAYVVRLVDDEHVVVGRAVSS